MGVGIGCYSLLSLPESHDPEGQAVFPVREAGASGTWHSCPCHVLSSLADPYDSGSGSVLSPGSHGDQNPQCTCWGCPCGKDQASALWDLHAARTHNSVFHPMCPSQSTCQQRVEAVVLLESQGLGQES